MSDPATDALALEAATPGTVGQALAVVPGVMRVRAALLQLEAAGRVEWRSNGDLAWPTRCAEHDHPLPCIGCVRARKAARASSRHA